MTDIDVIIPVRDVDQFLGDAIDSALGQLEVRTWVTIVDAGSANPIVLSSRHAVSERVTLVRSPVPLLAGGARNLGVTKTSGELLAFLDADDIWPTDRSASLVTALSTSATDMVVGSVRNFGDPASGLLIPEGTRTAYLAGGVLMPRTTFDAVGPFDETLRVGEFVDWHNRFSLSGLSAHVISDVVLERRVHRASTTASSAISQAPRRDDYLKVVRQWMNKND